MLPTVAPGLLFGAVPPGCNPELRPLPPAGFFGALVWSFIGLSHRSVLMIEVSAGYRVRSGGDPRRISAGFQEQFDR
jgi:hypothetical protein